MNREGRDKYLLRYGAGLRRTLVAAALENVEQTVVIPALAERESLFGVLASLARNPAGELARTLVICVVNNHRLPLAREEDFRDNQKTLQVLQAIVAGRPVAPDLSRGIEDEVQGIARSGLRLAFIDASSPGSEIPDRDGGVGTARKIGMDTALRLVDAPADEAVIACLDADTLVEENYLFAVRTHFSRTGGPAAVSAYAHRSSDDPALQAAIDGYEIFLRSYVAGLSIADSPYAFHSIGSTMSCSAVGYVRVRGMNRRQAAEDFHFLNKLAKTGRIGFISETTVHPSARPSHRVPFGTGRSMLASLRAFAEERRLYDPRIFALLAQWLAVMEAAPDRDPETILQQTGRIHPAVEAYLRQSRFAEAWAVIRKNNHDAGQLRRQFHGWFDGLKTLRLVHHLSRSAFPLVDLPAGVNGLLVLSGRPPLPEPRPGSLADGCVRIAMLGALRSAFPFS